MKSNAVKVVFDRRKEAAKKGCGYVDVVVNLGKKVRKYILIGTSTPAEWEKDVESTTVKSVVEKCQNILVTMDVLGEESNIENFNKHFYEEQPQEEEIEEENPPMHSEEFLRTRDFIAYCEQALANEDIAIGTRKHKQVVIDALKTFGKILTFADLTVKNLKAFDRWLHNGERTDVTIYGYHKRLKKWVSELERLDEIPRNPYKLITFNRGKCKERQPLLESELKLMREAKLETKLERVRDLFIFSAYTGLAFCDTQAFDYEKMTITEGNMTFIDGSRINTDTRFFTPILSPAMDVLKKYNYHLPHLSNQKANDYLHLIQQLLGFKKNLTFHVARHSFATLALAHDVPIENVARMLGHEDIRTTQIYAKILKTTIERHATNLQSAII